MSAEREVADLLEQAGEFPDGPGKVAVLEQAVALADAARDDGLAFEVRSDALWPAYHGSRPDLLLVWYAWCLAYLDRHPDVWPASLLWSYRWVVVSMTKFPSVARAQIDAASADMRDRYEAAGFSLRPVWLNRDVVARSMGDAESAADARRRYARCRRDLLSDDAEQDAAFAFGYHLFKRQDRAAVEAAGPILADPKCDLFPGTADNAVLPLARLGRVAEAAELRARAARIVARRPDQLGNADESMTFLAAVGDLAGAARHFDRHFAAVHAYAGDFSRLPMYKHGLFVARELVRRNKSPALKVPDGLIPGVAGTRATPGAVRDWLEVSLPELCARADARNGNRYHTDRLEDLDGFARLRRKLAG